MTRTRRNTNSEAKMNKTKSLEKRNSEVFDNLETHDVENAALDKKNLRGRRAALTIENDCAIVPNMRPRRAVTMAADKVRDEKKDATDKKVAKKHESEKGKESKGLKKTNDSNDKPKAVSKTKKTKLDSPNRDKPAEKQDAGVALTTRQTRAKSKLSQPVLLENSSKKPRKTQKTVKVKNNKSELERSIQKCSVVLDRIDDESSKKGTLKNEDMPVESKGKDLQTKRATKKADSKSIGGADIELTRSNSSAANENLIAKKSDKKRIKFDEPSACNVAIRTTRLRSTAIDEKKDDIAKEPKTKNNVSTKKGTRSKQILDRQISTVTAPSNSKSVSDSQEKPPKKTKKTLKPSKEEVKTNQNKLFTQNVAKDMPSTSKQVSPQILKSSPKILTSFRKSNENEVENNEEDPYSFELSQSEQVEKKVKRQRKQKINKKPGNRMDLLIQQKKLEAVGQSCNMQNNPSMYEAQRKNLEKQINVQPNINKIVVDLPPARTSNALSQRSSAPRPFTRVWHSPQTTLKSQVDVTDPQVQILTNEQLLSPPIQSKYAMKMSQIARFSVHNNVTPLRVSENLPSAFYMELSKQDGTPSYSSDLVSGKVPQSEEKLVFATPSTSRSFNDQAIRKSPSILHDSNAENMTPAGVVNSPLKKAKRNMARTPLKALAIASNITTSQHENKIKTLVDQESLVFDDETDSSVHVSQDESTTDTKDLFGFDELLSIQEATTKAGFKNDNIDIHKHLSGMKKYLPSKNFKNRDKEIFPTSPVKPLLRSPSKQSTIRKFISSSTPVVTMPRQSSRGNFGDYSAVAETRDEENESNDIDLQVENLFGENSKVQTLQRSYSRRKRATFADLPTDSSDDDSNEEIVSKKLPTKTKRKKLNIEQTGEFKRFVLEKSSEFAEVDNYEMVIE